MSQLRNQKIKMELWWWLFTAVVVLMALLPIWLKVEDYPFYWQNALLIIFFITFTRYIFLFRLTLVARTRWIKLVVILGSVLFLFVTATAMQDFRNFMDEEGLQTLVTDLNVHKQTRIMQYIKGEMIFFGVGSLITGVLLPLRMVISLWRMHNKGTV